MTRAHLAASSLLFSSLLMLIPAAVFADHISSTAQAPLQFVSTPPAVPQPATLCHNWNTEAFFQHADASTVLNCLELGADVLSRDIHGNTPLHWAARTTNDLTIIPSLFRAGGQLHARNRQGLQPLQVAATSHHDVAVIATLVNLGADWRTLTDDGRTLLHLAAASTTNPLMIDTLLSLGLALADHDDNGNTAIALSAHNKAPGVFDALVRAHRRLYHPSIFDVTPFRDENRVFFNVADRFPSGTQARPYRYSWCRLQEHLQYFPDLQRIGECDATDGVEQGAPPVLLEAQIGGDVSVGRHSAVRALAFSVEQRPPDGKLHSTWQVYATMVLRLRMMRSVSAPILPPSFMPKITYQHLGFSKTGPTTATMHATHVVFGHHSNGQTGCPFFGQPRRQDGECVEIAPGTPTGDINYATGNFSTHYVEFSKYWRWIAFDPVAALPPIGKTVAVGIEQHMPCKKGEDKMSRRRLGQWGTMCHLARRYGTRRLWVTVALDKPRYRLHARIMAIFGPEVTERYWGEGEFVLRLEDWPDLSIRAYGGQDPYNIRFEEVIGRFEIGFIFNWEDAAATLRGI